MANDHPIEPFPADTDRDAFGHWLSGFADGEACFYLGLAKDSRKTGHRQPVADFRIRLRSDDESVLRRIRSFWQCGTLYGHYTQRLQWNGATSNPQTDFKVGGARQLATVVVPHFDRYPLRAKKADDFAFWREAVLLAFLVGQRSWKGRRGRGAGCRPKWEPDEKARFQSLMEAMRGGRRFAEMPIEPSPPLRPPTRSLFDGLA